MKQSMLRIGLVLLTAIFMLSGTAFSGSLEPTAPPGSTMKTLDQIPPTWSQKLPAAQRFELVLDDEAVLDKETGLVWARSPDRVQRTWLQALNYCLDLQIGGRLGWRLPTVEELTSLVERSTADSPKLPTGHPFQNVQANYYWSASIYIDNPVNAWLVTMFSGNVNYDTKTNFFYVWPVRGGQ